MRCDRCGKETNILNYAINHVDDMDLCADCFSHMPDERRGDYTDSPSALQFRRERSVTPFAGPRPTFGRTNEVLRSILERIRNGETLVLGEEYEPTIVNRDGPLNYEGEYGPGPAADSYPAWRQLSNLSFGEPSNDLGAWLTTGEPYPTARLAKISMVGPAQRATLKRQFNDQRAALAAKDAIITQLRERLDRAKRGS